MRDPERTREAILAAAEQLIVERGINAFTLEEVASRASISKGGLLHHYRSKNALVEGLAKRMISFQEAEIEKQRLQDPVRPGAYVRAYLRTHVNYVNEYCQACASVCSESRNHPGMMKLFQDYAVECQRKIEEDGLDPAVASAVRYAAEGMASAAMWGMPKPSNFDQVVNYLLTLAGAKKTKSRKT